MAVPTALSRDVLAPHRVEPRVQVLEEPGPHVVDPWPAVGGGGTLVEHPLRGALPPAQRLAEHVFVAPARQHRRFERDEVERRIDRAEHGGNDIGEPRGARAVGRVASPECGGVQSGYARRRAVS